MAEDQLRTAFEAIHARLQDELDALRQTLEAQHTSAIAEARRQADEAAEAHWTAEVDALRAEAAAAAARARDEHDRALAVAREQLEAARHEAQERGQSAARAEQDHARELDEARAELAALTAARVQAESALESERERAAAALAVERQQLEAARQDAQQRAASAVQSEHDRARELDETRAQVAALTAARDQAESALESERERAAAALAVERQQLEAAQQDAQQRAESAARAEHDRGRELDEIRAELATLTAAREQAESTLQQERERAAAEIEAARQRAVALEHAQQQLQATFIADRDQALQKANALYERDTAAAVTEARAEERQAQLAIMERLLDAVKAIDGSRTLSETLTSLVAAARSHAPRTAVFIVNRDQLQPWKAAGFEDLGPQDLSRTDEGLLGRVVRAAEPVSSATAPAPAFAELAAGRAALAVPVIVGGQAVAVLYADDGGTQESGVPASWPEAVQILGRHASTCLAHLTAVRTVQAARFATTPSASAAPPAVPQRPTAAAPAASAVPPASDEESSARRYARLLVSEIKLYNESAVRVGRERRDLLTRLGAEIERAQRLYEERVPSSIGARSQYFHQELVQTLADGDPGLLGSSAGHR